MEKQELPIDIEKFNDYIASKFQWFGVTISDFFPDKFNEHVDYRRIDHLMSDIRIDGNKIALMHQDDDSFIENLKAYIPTMNSVIRLKTDYYFVSEPTNYV